MVKGIDILRYALIQGHSLQYILHVVAKYLVPSPIMTLSPYAPPARCVSTGLALLPAGWKNSGHHFFLGN